MTGSGQTQIIGNVWASKVGMRNGRQVASYLISHVFCRGAGYAFGSDISDRFNLMSRAHQLVMDVSRTFCPMSL